MELEHRFDLPVGITKAWATLTDIQTVGPCFPGAHLDSVEGDEFTGSVKLKVGPARLTYKGRARFVEKDAAARTAVIEATGTEGGASTAAMLVTATAVELAPNRTRIDLVTTLSLTGRPATFGRPMMVEVGNRLISSFADCVSSKLVGRGTGGAELVDVEDPDKIAAEREAALTAPAYALDASGKYVGRTVGGGTVPAAGENSLLKTALPAALVLIGAFLLRKLLRRKDSDDS